MFGLRYPILLIALTSTAASAQIGGQIAAPCPITLQPAGKGTIVGTVSDFDHTPIDSVEVYILSEKKQVLTDAKGNFRFEKLDAGKSYLVTARRFGYVSVTHNLLIDDNGSATSFCMRTTPRLLAPVISSAVRVGLTGVIADTAFGIIPGATIAVLGGGVQTYSDSMGRFSVDLKPGRYMVRVTHDQFQTKMVSVTIPPDSGRKMLIWLAPANRAAANREAWIAHDLQLRLDTASAARSRIWTREDLNNSPYKKVEDLARVGALQYVDDQCTVTVDGQYGMPLWLLNTDEVEMVEVYQPKPPRNAPTSISAGARMKTSAVQCPRVFAWLRKP